MQNTAQVPNFYERVLSIFGGEDPGNVLWQPRLEFWHAVNSRRGTLPEPLRHADLFQVYDYCHASVRYFGDGLRVRYRNVRVSEEWMDERQLGRIWETPIGMLSEVIYHDEWRLSAHHFVEHMGFEKTIYALHDYPQIVHHYVGVASEADDALYEVLCGCPAPILNLGENIDAHMDPPPIWQKYLRPYYCQRTDQLKAAGKFIHIHVDGVMKPLLLHLRDCPWDGIEAATPLPQGDVTLEEIKEALGDLVLLDGIPAVFFLPSYPVAKLVEYVRQIVDRFYPRLVLGISDELPPDGDIERVRLVGELVQSLP